MKPTTCPDYYLLSDGRELTDYLADEISLELAGTVSPYVAHCLYSAMEHRFRSGRKAGETETDIQAEAWWIDQARGNNLAEHGCKVLMEDMILRVTQLIDRQREALEGIKR